MGRGLSIEVAPEINEQICTDCGRPFSGVHGFLYSEGDAYAVYHALLQTDHPSTVADLAISFGRWSDTAMASHRTRVGIRVWPEGEQLKMHFNEPTESCWGDSETFGRMTSRHELVDTDLAQEALRAAEFIVTHDARVSEHLA
jgi:hypothetical protein